MQRLPFISSLFLVWIGCQQPSGSQSNSSVPPLMPASVYTPDRFTAPHPEKKDKTLTSVHGDTRKDEYYWLNERDNPAVTAYLEAENRYADSVMAPVRGLQDVLFEEMKARIKEDDNSVPYYEEGYWYYTRYETGKEYPIYCRKKGSLEGSEIVMLNVNELAKGKPYCAVGAMSVSPNAQFLFYATDYTGRNLYKGQILDMNSGQILPEEFDLIVGGTAWSLDSKFLFYDTKDKVTLRTDKVWRHELRKPVATDVQVFYEKDETAYASVAQSKDGKFAFINHGYSQNFETHFLDMSNPTGAFELIHARETGAFYDVEHHDGQFVIRSNWKGRNFSIFTTPVGKPARENWKELIPARTEALIASMEMYRDFLVLSERRGGLQQIHIYNWADGKSHDLDFGEPTYDASPMYLPDYESKYLRYSFSSLKTPGSVLDYEVGTRTKTLKKVEPVLGGFDSNNYETEFVWATSKDGVRIPVSLVYKKGVKKDGSAPCFQTGYGSYGFSYDPSFNRSVLSLLDRGFVFAIAHIRGGMEMGYDWYENGKMMHKINTFTDFIDCSEMLIQQKYTSKDRLFAQGGSAGGLLMGAVANMRPDLYKGMIASVPFMDVVTTMSDPSIPLTTGEYSEWGNPADKAAYDYMKSYSPYDNLQAKDYPNILVKTSFSDSQVQYFEPAKWVARLRDLKTDKNILLFHTNMSGSHGGASGRFERLKERAQEYSWMLGLIGSTDGVVKQ